jgi:hypothetical protein
VTVPDYVAGCAMEEAKRRRGAITKILLDDFAQKGKTMGGELWHVVN